ncbi:MAG TPA: M1 family peptidase, partial [bacterium]|nr:M1 family peptidase [bacterium]
YGQAPGPTFIRVTTQGGGTVNGTIPVERWLSPSTRVQSLTLRVNAPVARVDLDPEHFFPDVQRRNNSWTP